MQFYDVKNKTIFETEEYEIRQVNNRTFAVAKSPDGGHECWKPVRGGVK